MNKLLWTALVTLTSAVAARLAARAAAHLWRAATNENPPEAPTWARWIIGKPLAATVGATVSTTPS